MSFGLLKHFKDLKKNSHETVKTAHAQHIILGHDLGAVLKLVEIKKSFPGESIKLVSIRPITRNSLVETYDYNVNLIRSAEAVEGIYKSYFNAKIQPQSGDPIFYKDGKFHDFGGRAKSMEVLEGENFFTTPGFKLDVSSLFSEEDWENLDTILKEHQEIRIFESIEKTKPEDLVDKAEWTLNFKDFSRLTCENLYLSISPKKFLSLLHKKDDLTPELIDLCSSVKSQAAISVSWILSKEYQTEERTLFIPQSMTHEWGHFIVEFEAFDHKSGTQTCHVLFLIHEEEPQTEDLGSKIKLMKRVLDRVFNDIEKHITKEYIFFDEEMFVSNIKEEALEQVGFDYPSLKLIGQVSPVPSQFNGIQFLSRVLLK